MARRRRRRRHLGAVAKRGGSWSGSQGRHYKFAICGAVRRNVGSSRAHQYEAHAKPCKGKMGRGRYGEGSGRTPTAAIKGALRKLASKVR